jgi:phage replication initiation protein
MPNGLNYYKHAYTLENNCGFICIGGQNDTIMVSINGLGCTIGKYGWEEDLHAWLRLFATRPKLHVLTLAFDDFDSDFASVDWAKEQQELGGFKMGGRPPNSILLVTTGVQTVQVQLPISALAHHQKCVASMKKASN